LVATQRLIPVDMAAKAGKEPSEPMSRAGRKNLPAAPASQDSYRTSRLTRPVPLFAVAPKPRSGNRLAAIRRLIND
jgi:hypothetical protein